MAGYVYLINSISSFVGYLVAKKNSLYTIHSIVGRVNGYQRFTKCISPNADAIAQLVFELVYFETVVQVFNNYATRSPI